VLKFQKITFLKIPRVTLCEIWPIRILISDATISSKIALVFYLVGIFKNAIRILQLGTFYHVPGDFPTGFDVGSY
jgi:hypothetical protein